jgi:hypothetical protein
MRAVVHDNYFEANPLELLEQGGQASAELLPAIPIRDANGHLDDLRTGGNSMQGIPTELGP